MFFKNYFV